ncbi:DNA mismatch endonuclease Vsr [uncultured Parabacteroides sp.]|uniref:very short patch repair endonuclease n=1 Tax=uncultured Parabacteroides sp. TaxID=512312 RepID=UPI00259BE3C8|nr:DNA mismatch endonuclease Vsr [uncultured Parabacteroides sp.]
MDIWDKKKRSSVMAKIKSKDTRPEILVRCFLYSKGYRYRKNVKKMPGTPDIVLGKYKTVIFIHGCFWHGHTLDCRVPHTNVDYWLTKIERNKVRDRENEKKLMQMGWNIIIIWECQLKNDVREKTFNTIIYLIDKIFLDQYRIPFSIKKYSIPIS